VKLAPIFPLKNCHLAVQPENLSSLPWRLCIVVITSVEIFLEGDDILITVSGFHKGARNLR
jgi:hypothetical protein